MQVSIIVLFRNEEEYVKQVLEEIFKPFKSKKLTGEIIAVDDSTDKTYKILLDLAKKYSFLKVIKGRRMGFGNALRLGIENAEKDIIVPYNGDGADDPEDVVKLVKEMEKGYDAVFGSRFVKGGKIEGHPFFKYLISRGGNFLTKVLFRVSFNDFTNLLKAYRRDFIENINLESDGFTICIELPLRVIKKGGKIIQIPVVWRGRKKGDSKMNAFSSTIKYLVMMFRVFLNK